MIGQCCILLPLVVKIYNNNVRKKNKQHPKMCTSLQVGVVAMARPGRPVSETYQQVCYSGSQSISLSGEAETVEREDEDDHAPIFSLSKSSMDVVMATGPTHKRDPVWTRTDLRRSSSTNTHSESSQVSLEDTFVQRTAYERKSKQWNKITNSKTIHLAEDMVPLNTVEKMASGP